MLTVHQIAKMIDHSLLNPTMTDEELREGCLIAKQYDVAAVCIKPYAVSLAAQLLKDTSIAVCTVVGFPQGANSIQTKVFETRQACKDGANEIDMVVNIGKVLSEDWRYVKKEIAAINKECKKHGASLKVIFENDFLPKDKYKIKLCKICSIVGVAYIKTSTGFGFTKQANGDYNYKGATATDLILMRKYSSPEVKIKAAGGVRTLDELLKIIPLGIDRLGASATVAILEEAKKRF